MKLTHTVTSLMMTPTLLIIASALVPAWAEAPVKPISFSGRVVEVIEIPRNPAVGKAAVSKKGSLSAPLGGVAGKADGGKPIAGAVVVVSRAIAGVDAKDAPAWAGESTLHTDAEGRFTLTFPPEQLAEPRLSIAFKRVSHPDFVPRKSIPVALATLLQGRKFGEKPFFDTIRLERGVVHTGQVVTPEGEPAAEVPFEFGNWSMSNQSPQFSNETAGRTDAQGRFRVRLSKLAGNQAMSIALTPERYAPFQNVWRTDQSTDLGRLTLAPGPVLKGRLLDREGRPVAGQRLVAWGRRNGLKRTATSDDDGAFAFAPLRPGNYDVSLEGQTQRSVIPSGRSSSASAPVVRPVRVYFKKGEQPAPVELREVPSVQVAVRFVDANGGPARGNAITLSGVFPIAPEKAQAAPAFDAPALEPIGPAKVAGKAAGGGIALKAAPALLQAKGAAPVNNADEPEDKNPQASWFCQLWPDADGRVAFRAPKGLINVFLNTFPPDETVAYQTRLEEGGPPSPSNPVRLGTLDADRAGITVVTYRSPTVVAEVRTEDGDVSTEASVQGFYTLNGNFYGTGMIRQADGRYRTQHLVPGQEYHFAAYAPGYVPNTVQRVTLPEGGLAELTLVARRQPKPLEVDDGAPGFVVKTLDGEILSLDSFRGKFLLLHFWSPDFGPDIPDLADLKAIHQKFGKDKRFTMLSLCPATKPDAVSKIVKEEKLSWPQALLRDRNNDPIVLNYQGWSPSRIILIGPNGKVVATNLKGNVIGDAVAEALGKERAR